MPPSAASTAPHAPFRCLDRCLDPCLTIAAAMSFKSPFVAPLDKRDEADRKKQEFLLGSSDHLTTLLAYNSWRDVRNGGNSGDERRWCQENFLSSNTLRMIGDMKAQLLELLAGLSSSLR